MSLIIDGYNLLHATGIMGRGGGPGGLERSRVALLNFLAASLEPDELSRATVVFDAGGAPPGLPRTVEHRGITVRYASQYESADDLIEELIKADTAPRSLTVVSSDHRIQRAAARRKAKAIDSDRWYADLVRRRREKEKKGPSEPDKPRLPMTAAEVDRWLKEFAVETPDEQAEEFDNPFPPGYGEDLLRDGG